MAEALVTSVQAASIMVFVLESVVSMLNGEVGVLAGVFVFIGLDLVFLATFGTVPFFKVRRENGA